MKIALIGNPNSGKTSLFNALTGSRQRVGNWPGVTVEQKKGAFSFHGEKIEIVDLPGIYDLEVAHEKGSLDEKVARDYLFSKEASCIINVVDASNLERNLYLTMQLAECGLPIILALNMMDIAKGRGIQIDMEALSKALGIPVIPIIARKKKGLYQLKESVMSKNAKPVKHTKLVDKVHSLQRQLLKEHNESPDLLLADARYQVIHNVLQHSVASIKTKRKHFSDTLDRIMLNRFLGLPIFFLVMYLMFEFSITIGGAFQPLFDEGSQTIFIDGVNYLGALAHAPVWLTAIFAEGIGLGINTVLTFIPQIGAMFLFLSFIEDSGYMNRAAFVMDRLMQAIGLPGKSFIPLIVGFGCNVPAIMAARTLDSRRDRLLTIMMSPFISCGARLAIFAVFASSFFPHGGGLVVFILYIIGILIALLTGIIIRGTLLKGEPSPFILEIPPYHLPQAKSLFIHTWQRLQGFVWRAGKVIVPVCLIVGGLNSIDWHGRVYPSGSPHSILASVSGAITPVFEPMGVNQQNWPATVGLVTGTLAKEVVVGTLNTLYSQNTVTENDDAPFDFWQGMKTAVSDTVESLKGLSSSSFSNPFRANEASAEMTGTAMGKMVLAFGSVGAAFAYMLFVLLYVPCVSTIAVINREAGKSWAFLSTFWSFLIAYVAATISYKVCIFNQRPLSSSLWITTMLVLVFLFIAILKRYALHYALKNTNPLFGLKK